MLFKNMYKSINKLSILFVILIVAAQLIFTLVQNTGFSFAQTAGVPAAPSSLMLAGTPTATSISISWIDNATDEDKFNVERKLTTDTYWTGAWSTQLLGSNITAYTDTSVASGTAYDYRVQACHSGYGCSDYAYLIGVSSASTTSTTSTAVECLLTVSVSPNTPAAQTVSSGQTGVSLVKFNLNPNCAITLNSFAVSLLPMSDGYTNISSLRLYIGSTQVGSSMSVTNASVNFTGLGYSIPASQTIVLEVKADIASSAASGSTVYGSFGGSSATSGSGSSVGNNASGSIIAGNTMTISGSTGDTSSPSMPTSLAATKDNYNEVDLQWAASSDNIGVTGYEVWRSVSGAWSKIGTATVPSYIDTGVAASTSYYYKVIAYDAAGNKSPSSAELFLNTPAAAVATVSCTSLALTLNDGKTSYNIGDYVNYTWTCSPGGSASNVSIGLKKPDNSLVIYNYGSGSTQSMGFSTSNLISGSYVLKACFDSNCATANASQNFSVVSNVTATPTPTPTSTAVVNSTSFVPSITTGINYSVSGSIISGKKTLWANSTAPLTGGVTFKFYNNASGVFSSYIVTGYPSTAVAPDAFGNYNYWLGDLDTSNLANGSYELIARAIYNSKTYENTLDFYFNVNNPVVTPVPQVSQAPIVSPSPVSSPAASPNLSPSPAVTPDMNYFPLECREKGLTTPEACQNYMQFPPECRKENILDQIKCQQYMFQIAMPEVCREKGITTQEECSKVIFEISTPKECLDAKITDEAGCVDFLNSRMQITPECKEANIVDPQACGNFMAEKFMPKECADAGAKTKEECDYIMRSKYGNLTGGTAAEMKAFYPFQVVGSMPPECQAQNVTDSAGCEKIMIAKYMPEDCKAANITSKDACEKFLFEKNAPKECINAKITDPKTCEAYIFKMNAPQDCIDVGITSPEGCKKFMFEKYGDAANIPLDKFPIECQKAGVKTVDACEKVMTQAYMPEECKKNGIADSGKCDEYFKQKYMPEECRAAGVKTQSECDKVMFKKFAPDECNKAGIENEKECKDYIFNLYAVKASCKDLDELQCRSVLKENYLGAISSKQIKFTKVRDEIAPLAGGATVQTEELRKKLGDGKEIIPIKEGNVGLKVVKTSEDMVLDEDRDLIQTASAAVMVDSDNDGLPDDMEKRIGTDPANPDTDSDGIKDGEEVKAGYNPFGEGKIAEGKISPIDEAILNDQTLSHPKTTGSESDKYSFDQIANIGNGADTAAAGKYLFAGKADSDSVVTLYIYSDLPIVVTVKTDKYGNWNYEFDKSLTDGEHEAYVALNDNAGRVVTRSAIMSFFVNEAKAISVSDFISPANAAAEPVKASEKAMTNYAFMTAAVIFAGIIIFIGLVIVLRRKHAPKA